MKRYGFTIAETLVTLLILGIIGALTIPSLVGNYRKEVLGTSLSTAVSNFENAMVAMMMKENADNLFETSAWENLENGLNNGSGDNIINRFKGDIGETLKMSPGNTNLNKASEIYKVKAKGIYDISGTKENVRSIDILDDAVPIRASNGSIYFIRITFSSRSDALDDLGDDRLTENEILQLGGNLYLSAADVIIDVNGKDMPNTIGRDLFEFTLGEDGILYPTGGLDQSIYLTQEITTWRDSDHYAPCTDNKKDDGWGCTARLIENNYKMDY